MIIDTMFEESGDISVWRSDEFKIPLYKEPIYEIQLGVLADGAKNGDIDYNSPALMLVESDHYPSIEEIEQAFEKEIG